MALRYTAGESQLTVNVKELKGIRVMPGRTTASEFLSENVLSWCSHVFIRGYVISGYPSATTKEKIYVDESNLSCVA